MSKGAVFVWAGLRRKCVGVLFCSFCLLVMWTLQSGVACKSEVSNGRGARRTRSNAWLWNPSPPLRSLFCVYLQLNTQLTTNVLLLSFPPLFFFHCFHPVFPFFLFKIQTERPMKIEIVLDPSKPAPSSLVARVASAPATMDGTGQKSVFMLDYYTQIP